MDKQEVWIDWGHADRAMVTRHSFDTLEQLNAFLSGVLEASIQWGLDDWRQYDSEQEMENAFDWQEGKVP